MRARSIIAGGVAAAAGLTVFVLSRSESSTPQTTGADRSAAMPWSLVASRDLATGIEHRYAVELDHTSRPNSGNPFALGVDGEWKLSVLSTDEQGVTTIRAELERPRVRLGTVWSPAPRFGAPYTFTLTRDGTLVALQLPRGLDTESRTLLTALTATAQLTERRAATWTAIETDALGSFEAEYRREHATLHKTKRRYRPLGGNPLAIDVVRSATEIALRDDGWPESISQQEEIRVGFDKAVVTVAGRVTLRHIATRNAIATLPTNLEAVAIDATSMANRDDADRELLDGATLQDLIAIFGTARDDGNTTAHTYLRLVALFRLDPAAAKEAAQTVHAGTLDKRDNAAVIGALGEAGTTETQHLLADLVKTPTLAQEHRVHGTLALGLTAEPTSETIATLATTSRLSDPELASTATLALGNAAFRLHDKDGAAASAQVDELLARLRAATDLETRITLVRALGNTGDPRALPALAASLSSSNDLERAAAAESTRLMPGIDGDKLILLALDDRSSIVRAGAVFAASDRPLAALLARLVTLGRSDEVMVRRAIVELAASRMTEHAELRALVEYAASHDPDPELRSAALRALGKQP